jgi:hypothetical protein
MLFETSEVVKLSLEKAGCDREKSVKLTVTQLYGENN